MSLRNPQGAPRRLSYANVIATLALVLAVGGGTAWAAHHYLITSTGQIKPSVVKSLRGHNGTNGTNGTNGATGATGGPGSTLTAETVLASGQSESGTYASDAQYSSGIADVLAVAIQYTQPLASPIPISNIDETSSTSANCPGQGHAARGYLCLYDLENVGATWDGPINNYGDLPSPDPGALLFYFTSSDPAYVFGTWTVTAP
jgi:hypothetical protein